VNDDQPAVAAGGRTGVAPRLHDLLVQLFGIDPPVRLVGWDGSSAGTSDGPTVHVRNRRAVRRLLWAPGELGLARAYVAGDLDVEGDLLDSFRTLADYGALIGSRPELRAVDRREVLRTAVLLGAVGPAPRPPEEEQLLRAPTGPRGARDQAASDLSPAGRLPLLRSVLGPALAYSSALWGPDVQTLEEAQRHRLEVICDRLGLQPGMRLLDLGCGWGPLVVHAVEHRGVEVVGTVRSAERATLVRQRVEALGMTHRADIRLGTVDAVDDGPYDAIAALESIEDVDDVDLLAWVAHARQLLRPGGRLVLQALTARAGAQASGATFMSSYVMPQGPLPPVGTLVGVLEDGGLEVRQVEAWREHYGPTMQAWLTRLDADPGTAARVLGEGRLRVWRLSLALATIGFERGRIGLHLVQAVRPHADGRSGMLGSGTAVPGPPA
jgi:cyclopropane-fatty-acyl-phospholipid synthase